MEYLSKKDCLSSFITHFHLVHNRELEIQATLNISNKAIKKEPSNRVKSRRQPVACEAMTTSTTQSLSGEYIKLN